MKSLFVALLALIVFSLASASPVVAASKSAAAPFHVNSIAMSVSPATLTTWTCGSSIQVVYHAFFRVTPGLAGGVINFSTTTNNGRSETPEKLTIIPGQTATDFVFTWQGALPADHTMPSLGGVLVTAPNTIISPMVQPGGACR